MLSNEKYEFSDREIIEKGSRALIKELGYSGKVRETAVREALNQCRRRTAVVDINLCHLWYSMPESRHKTWCDNPDSISH